MLWEERGGELIDLMDRVNLSTGGVLDPGKNVGPPLGGALFEPSQRDRV